MIGIVPDVAAQHAGIGHRADVDVSRGLGRLLRALPGHLRLALTQLQPMAPLVPQPLVDAAIDEARLGRDYLRAGHMARLQAFTNKSLLTLTPNSE